jgi:hypothetical protein
MTPLIAPETLREALEARAGRPDNSPRISAGASLAVLLYASAVALLWILKLGGVL